MGSLSPYGGGGKNSLIDMDNSVNSKNVLSPFSDGFKIKQSFNNLLLDEGKKGSSGNNVLAGSGGLGNNGGGNMDVLE